MRALVAVLILVVAGLGLLGTQWWGGEGQSGPEPLRIGILIWPPYEMAFLARSLGEYEDRPVQLIDYRTPAEAMRAYRNKLIDGVALTGDYFLQLAEKDPKHRIVSIIDFSNGGDALVVKPEIRTLSDLKGQRVGIEASALGAYMLTRILEVSGLDSEDIEKVAIDVADQEAAFLANRCDAVVTYEPTRSRLLATGAKVLFDSSMIPGEIVDVLIFHDDFLVERRDDVRRFLAGWDRAIRYLADHPLDAAKRVCEREKMTPEEYLESLKGAKIPSRIENIELLSTADSPVYASLRRSAEVQRTIGLIKEPYLSLDLLDATILQEIAP